MKQQKQPSASHNSDDTQANHPKASKELTTSIQKPARNIRNQASELQVNPSPLLWSDGTAYLLHHNGGCGSHGEQLRRQYGLEDDVTILSTKSATCDTIASDLHFRSRMRPRRRDRLSCDMFPA